MWRKVNVIAKYCPEAVEKHPQCDVTITIKDNIAKTATIDINKKKKVRPHRFLLFYFSSEKTIIS